MLLSGEFRMSSHQIVDKNLDWTFEIKKHSSLIQIWSSISLVQRKSINAIIFLVKIQLETNPELRIFKLKLGILKKLAGIAITDNSKLKKSILDLSKLNIEYNVLNKDKQVWWVFNFLSHAQIEIESRGVACEIIIELPSPIIDAIINPNMYCKLNLAVVRQFQSKHSLALYEVLRDYIGIKKIYISIENIRRLFWLTDRQYKSWFSMFRKRVVDKAIEEINRISDLNVTILWIRKISNHVLWITFLIKFKNKNYRRSGSDTENQLVKLGFSRSRSRQLCSQYDNLYIAANIAAIEEQYSMRKESIKSLPALLTSALKSNYVKNSSSKVKQILEDEYKKTEALNLAREKQQKSEDRAERSKKLKALLSKMPSEEKDDLRLSFVDQLGNLHIAGRYLKRWIPDHPIVVSAYENYLMKKLGIYNNYDVG